MADGKSELAGMIISKVNVGGLPGYEHCGWISSLVIDGKYRNQGLGKELYDKAEAVFIERGIKKVILGGEENCFFSGIPEPEDRSIEFFSKRGFIINVDKHYDLMADVSRIDFDTLDPLVNHEGDYIVREMSWEDINSLNTFFDKSFPGRWKHEVMGYVKNGGDLRNVLILWDNEEVAGFCKIYVSESISDSDELYGYSWGSLGPIGIDGNLRGKGLGKKLLLDSLNFLKRRDAHNVIIDWTILKEFYGQFGFKPWRTYRGGYKYLSSNFIHLEGIF